MMELMLVDYPNSTVTPNTDNINETVYNRAFNKSWSYNDNGQNKTTNVLTIWVHPNFTKGGAVKNKIGFPVARESITTFYPLGPKI